MCGWQHPVGGSALQTVVFDVTQLQAGPHHSIMLYSHMWMILITKPRMRWARAQLSKAPCVEALDKTPITVMKRDTCCTPGKQLGPHAPHIIMYCTCTLFQITIKPITGMWQRLNETITIQQPVVEQQQQPIPAVCRWSRNMYIIINPEPEPFLKY
jgi:hypothetical protein